MPVFQLKGAVIATRGNLVAVQAPAKAGKTAFIGAMTAAPMQPTGDCLGLLSSNPQSQALIHFDCEQSPNDHYTCNVRALKRAGLKSPPEWFRSYSMTDQPLGVRKCAFYHEIERAKIDCGGVLAVIVDGVADLCADPNDAKEAFALIDALHQTAIRYDTVIVCILHENPGSEIGKTRGHLGSQLERKAESNIRLSKDSNGVTTIFAERARHAHISKEDGPRFKWCDDAGMHISTAARAQTMRVEKRNSLMTEAVEVFRGAPTTGLTWTETHQRIEVTAGVKRSGARRHFDDMVALGVINKAGENYQLSPG